MSSTLMFRRLLGAFSRGFAWVWLEFDLKFRAEFEISNYVCMNSAWILGLKLNLALNFFKVELKLSLKTSVQICHIERSEISTLFARAKDFESIVLLWYQGGDLNSRPPAYETSALTSWATLTFNLHETSWYDKFMVEHSGFEPLTSTLPASRSPSWANAP